MLNEEQSLSEKSKKLCKSSSFTTGSIIELLLRYPHPFTCSMLSLSLGNEYFLRNEPSGKYR